MTLYALGDLHISATIWDLFRAISGDSAFMLSELKGLLSGDDDLVLCGDVFDSSEPGPTLTRMFREWAEDVTAAGNRLWAIQGNHDKRIVSWTDAVTSCVTYVGNGAPFSIAGIRCAALDYAPRDTIARKLAELGTRKELPEILFLHQAVRQYLDIDGTWNCDLEWVPAGIPLVVLGDIHEPWGAPVRSSQDVGFQYACYTGAGHTRSITEAKHGKSVLRINSTSGTPRDITRVPIRSRAIAAASLTAATLEKTREGVRGWVKHLASGNAQETAPASLLTPVIHLTYTDDVPSAPELLREAVADLGIEVIIMPYPVVVRTTGTSRVDLAAAVAGIPGIPALLEKSGLAKSQQVASVVLDLIRPGKPAEIRGRLDVVRAQFFADYDKAQA